jgi:hypothetical protein
MTAINPVMDHISMRMEINSLKMKTKEILMTIRKSRIIKQRLVLKVYYQRTLTCLKTLKRLISWLTSKILVTLLHK